MANKSARYTYRGANQDITKSKHSNEYYFDAEHVRIVATSDSSSGSITNEKGTESILTLPSISINVNNNTITYGSSVLNYINNNELEQEVTAGNIPTSSSSQKIIGHSITRTGFVLFSTDDAGMDCIWHVENAVSGDYTLELLYLRNLGFSINNPIQAVYNYENENIQKVYWVDGVHQIRNINLKHNTIEGNTALIEVPVNSIDFVGTVTFSQPIISSILTGGNNKAGMVQYAYNLYRLNSSQTKISPLSELVPLANTQGGAEPGETVSAVPVVSINNIDTSYDYIKVYAIKYTTLNSTPSIELIAEREISGDNIIVYDTGSVKDTLTLEEFVFLGSDPIVPNHIQSKDNRLFPANIKTKPFILPDALDMRAFSYPINSTTTKIYNNVSVVNNEPVGTSFLVVGYNSLPDKNHDAINITPDLRRYKRNSNVLGATGKYIEVEIVRQSVSNPETKRFFKDEEFYRIGIEFYNNLGQTSLPYWVVDYKMPKGNLEGLYNTLRVNLRSTFYTDFVDVSYDDEAQRPVGYRILVAKREEVDKTIISQGIITPMMFQVLGDEATNYSQFKSSTIRRRFQDSELKMPTFLTRNFSKIPVTAANDNNGVLLDTRHLAWLNDDPDNNKDEGGEIYTTRNEKNKISQSFQHTKMMQMYTPEVLFELPSNVSAASQLKVVGLAQNTLNGVFAEERLTSSKETIRNGKSESGLNPYRITSDNYIENNSFKTIFYTPESVDTEPQNILVQPANSYGFIGLPGNAPSKGGDSMAFYQYYRQFNSFINNTNNTLYQIYKSPEVTTRGADTSFYGGDANFKYANSLLAFTSDGEDDCSTCPLVASINSYNSRCITFVLGGDNVDTINRKSLENLHAESSISATKDGVLIGELRRDINYPFTGSMYGGNTYEDKKRTTYVGVGSYQDINTDTVNIESAGDTYVQSFRFLRIHKTDTEVYDVAQLQISEIVEFTVETTVDLKNRHDLSFSGWDARFQPQETEFHKYNTVYSQQSNLITTEDTPFTFRRVDNFDTRIQSTKLKTPNESIDSWTDIFVNETLDINGKYGPINHLVEFNDELYAFQDEAISKILINPNVQIQATDNVGIELGTGSVLYDYNYLTTKSGAVNKWGIVTGKRGIYYYDLLNKGIGRVPDASPVLLTDIKGMHTYFNNNYDYDLLAVDNPMLQSGVVAGIDNYNNDIYFTLHQGDKSFTRCFNELRDEFIDLKTYTPVRYLNKGEKLYSGSINNNTLHEHYAGDYNNYYGEFASSKITLLVNPESDLDTIINNIQYASEVYLNNFDQPTNTLTHIRAYNEYQDTGRIPLILGRSSNLRRRFREWKAAVPREANKRRRIRNPWIYLELEFENTTNLRLILHDIMVKYTA